MRNTDPVTKNAVPVRRSLSPLDIGTTNQITTESRIETLRNQGHEQAGDHDQQAPPEQHAEHPPAADRGDVSVLELADGGRRKRLIPHPQESARPLRHPLHAPLVKFEHAEQCEP